MLEVNYLAARSGWFLKKRNAITESVIKVDSNPEADEVEESLTFVGKKVPMNVFRQWLAFARGVAERDKHGSSEAALMLFYHPETNVWDAFPPKQKLTVASVDYSGVTEAIQKFRESKGDRKWLPAGTFHSHPGGSSEPSSTDEKDEEKFDGIHIIVPDFGKKDDKGITIHATATGQRFVFKKPSHIIDFDAAGEVAAVPDSWYEQIKFGRDPFESKGLTPVGGRYGGGYQYGGYGWQGYDPSKRASEFVSWSNITSPSKVLKKLGFSKEERKEILSEGREEFFEQLCDIINEAKDHVDDVRKSKTPISQWELERFKKDAEGILEKLADFVFAAANNVVNKSIGESESVAKGGEMGGGPFDDMP